MTVVLLKRSAAKAETSLREETYTAVRSLFQGQSGFLKDRVARKLKG